MCNLHLGLNTLKGGDITAVKCAGLPNIIGSVTGSNRANFNGATGAFSIQGRTSRAYHDGSANSYSGFTFDASLSSTIYGKANTVQAPAMSLIPQSKI